jgi:hypothetical protein
MIINFNFETCRITLIYWIMVESHTGIKIKKFKDDSAY